MVWAKVSDRIGRRRTLLIGILCGIVSAVSFGLLRSVAAAVAARAIGGLLNPNVGVVQTCIGELAERKEQQGTILYILKNGLTTRPNHLTAKAFSLVPFLRGLG